MELILGLTLGLLAIMSISLFLEFKKYKEYKKGHKEQFKELEFANSKIEYLREELSKAESENSELIKQSWRFTKNDKVVFKNVSLSNEYGISVDKVFTVVQYTCEDIVLVYDGSYLHQIKESNLEWFNPRENMEIVEAEYSFEQPIGEETNFHNLRLFVHELYKKGLLDIESSIVSTGNEETIYKISAVKVKP